MPKVALLIGNDINNVVPDNSWKDLLNDIVKFCGAEKLVPNRKDKPFPLLYEEIFLKSVQRENHDEKELKKFISKKVLEIEPNEIHSRIRELDVADIITTNYEFLLEGRVPEKNEAVIDEKLYSVFRHYTAGKQKIWHAHGDCRVPNSITLGFEHYGGQLQQMRNFVATGTNYKSKALTKIPLVRRLKEGQFEGHSWIELFFTHDIYIFGLTLDFVETDLWWLLTYRSRAKFYMGLNISNSIHYFLPTERKGTSKEKIDLFQANGVTVIDSFSGKDKKNYYQQILSRIEKS